ncbi:MAG: hypothetical protein NT080_12945 [Spirochaetes bacterium]|nr:hypothetical protein [Spirochaetota bacterium]
MGKITQEQRTKFSEKVQELKKSIDAFMDKEKMLNDAIGADQTNSVYKRLMAADEILNLTSYYLLLNAISVSLLGIKNEDHLDNARKSIARAFTHLEASVSNLIDAPFSEYEKKLEAMADFSADSRYKLLSKLGFAIRDLEESYGSGSKWKWFFVDFWGKYASVAKNMLDLKAMQKNLDFDSPIREVTKNHLALVKRQLAQSADRFREKYEISSSSTEDFRSSILFLSALRRIHVLCNDRDEAEDLKRKIEIWKGKLETDLKKKDGKK